MLRKLGGGRGRPMRRGNEILGGGRRVQGRKRGGEEKSEKK